MATEKENAANKNPAKNEPGKGDPAKLPHPVWVLLKYPLWLPISIFEGCLAWLMSRHWLKALPSLIVLLPAACIAYGVIYGVRETNQAEAARYLQLADAAEAAKDERALAFHYRKLINTPLEPAFRFKVARFLASRGQRDQARQQMQMLAPENSKSYGGAHLWLAQDLLTLGPIDSQAKLDRVVHHSSAAAELMRDDATAQALYGQILLQTGQPAKAVTYFEQAAKTLPEVLLQTAVLHLKLGNQEQGKILLDRASVHYVSKLREDPKQIDARIALVNCYLIDNDLNAAFDTLQDGLKLSDDMQLRVKLADCHVQSYDQLPVDQRLTPIGLARLEQAVLLAPNHTPTLVRIAQLIANDPNVDWGIAKERLLKLLADGQAPATVHMLLANGHLSRKEFDVAKIHLEQAYQQDKTMIVVLNNLAWIFANVEPIDMTRAQTLIEQAMQIDPNLAEVRETYGQILIKSGKLKEGIAELEALLRKLPKRVTILEALAGAYEKKGDTETARIYREQAAQLPQPTKN